MVGISWTEISVLRDQAGAPYLSLSGGAKEAVKGRSFTVSITHTRDTASAVVIIYNKNDEKNH